MERMEGIIFKNDNLILVRMPTYTYICDKCKRETILLCTFKEKKEHEKTLKCSHCNSNTLNEEFCLNLVGESKCSGKTCCGGSCSNC